LAVLNNTPRGEGMSAGVSIGLVHDYLLVMRGAERTFAAMAACWPEAELHTLLYDAEGTGHRFSDRTVNTSYLQRLGVRQGGFRRLLPLFPRAAAHLPVSQHDIVVSSSSAFAHGVRPRAGAKHLCYCHSPFRYVWHERERALGEAPQALRPLAARMLARIRRWDVAAAGRVDRLVANSAITQKRIADFWGRDSTVIHPPVDTARFEIGVPEDFFLVVCEVVRHKRVDVALDAARRAEQPIKVVGTGPDLERLKALFPEAEFLERISDAHLGALLGRARALVVPNVEEFGVAAVEAQASGRPVLGTSEGGTAETVAEGRTGHLVPPGDVDALAEAMRHGDFDRFSGEEIRTNAERFSTEAFQRRLGAEVARLAATTG